jgi:uncharacterized protein (DUF58 family)
MFAQQYIRKWLDKRIPAANEFQLNHRSIFIFPAKFGGLFLALCALLFLLGTNYQNNLMLLLCYFLLALFLVNLLASYTNFANLTVKLGRIPEVYAGDEVHLPLWINADTIKDSGLHGIVNISLIGEKVSHWFECGTLTNPLMLDYPSQNRGWHKLPRITFSSYYPLGLYKCWTHLAFSREILVYPKPIPCALNVQEVNSEQDSTKQRETTLNRAQNHDDFSHLKRYQIGDPLRHVAWKQLAKGRGMFTKQFAGVEQIDVWLILPKHASTPVEYTLSTLCFQVLELSRSGSTFGLDLGSIKLAPNSGESHRIACLQALALYPQNNTAGVNEK